MNRLSILIDGMHCDGCVIAARQALEAVAGVRACEVRLGEVEVTFDPSVASKSELLDALRSAGPFTVSRFSVR